MKIFCHCNNFFFQLFIPFSGTSEIYNETIYAVSWASLLFGFLADKHTEVGTMGLATVTRNVFTKNIRILSAIKIHSSQPTSISKAIFAYWDGGLDSFSILKLATQALGTCPRVRTGK